MNSRGGGRLNALLAIVITAAIILAAVRTIPVYVNSVEFEDSIRNEARFASVNRKPPSQIHQDLFRKAQALDLPVRSDMIQVVPSGSGGAVRIACRYLVEVDLIVYKPRLNFDFRADTNTTY